MCLDPSSTDCGILSHQDLYYFLETAAGLSDGAAWLSRRSYLLPCLILLHRAIHKLLEHFEGSMVGSNIIF